MFRSSFIAMHCILCVLCDPSSSVTNLETSSFSYFLLSSNKLYNINSKGLESSSKSQMAEEGMRSPGSSGQHTFSERRNDGLINRITASEQFRTLNSGTVFPKLRGPSISAKLDLVEMHERAKTLRRNEVRQSILDKLRLLAPPNITALKQNNKLKELPEHMLWQFVSESASLQGPQYHDNYHARSNKVIQFAADFPKEKYLSKFPVESIAYFPLSQTVSEKNVKRATLLLYIATPEGYEGKKIKLTVSDAKYRNESFVNRAVLLRSRGHWERVDVSQMVRSWAADEDNNYGLYIRAMIGQKNVAYLNEDPIEARNISTKSQKIPLLKLKFNNQPIRHKRNVGDDQVFCNASESSNNCCVYSLVVDFAELGEDYDFIIQPRRFVANYCAGTCGTYHTPNDLHERLTMGLSRPGYQRCCAPASKTSLQVLHYDDNQTIREEEFPEMTVERCQCV